MKTESGLCGPWFTVCSRRRWRRGGRGPRSRDPQMRGGRGPVGARAPEKRSPAHLRAHLSCPAGPGARAPAAGAAASQGCSPAAATATVGRGAARTSRERGPLGAVRLAAASHPAPASPRPPPRPAPRLAPPSAPALAPPLTFAPPLAPAPPSPRLHPHPPQPRPCLGQTLRGGTVGNVENLREGSSPGVATLTPVFGKEGGSLSAALRSVAESHPTLLRLHGLQPARLLCPWESPGKKTGVGCHFLLQGSS